MLKGTIKPKTRMKESGTATSTQKPKSRIGTWISLGIVSTILVISGLVLITQWSNRLTDQKGMEQYLKDKYGSTFAVSNLHTEGGGLGANGSIVGDAHPSKDPSLRFKIWRDENDTQRDYSDLYLRTLWTRQAKQKVDAFVAKLGNVASYRLEVLPDSIFASEHRYPAPGRTISLDEGMKKYGNHITYTLGIGSSTPATNHEPSIQTLDRAFKIVEFVKDQNVQNGLASYAYKDKTFSKTNKYGDAIYQYQILVENSAIKSVVSTGDLRTYYKKLR